MSVPASRGEVNDAGGPERFGRLYPRVYAFARRLAGPALAEDIAQEVFLRVLVYPGKVPAELPIGFLLAMARNVASTMCTARRAEALEPRTSVGGPDLPGLAEDRDSAIRRLLDSLPRRQRDAVELTTARGLSECQAGLALSMSRSAVSARRRQALEGLRRAGNITAGRDDRRRER